MNRIVLDHYPIARLPEDLREMAPGSEFIRLVMEPSGEARAPEPKPGFSLERLYAQSKPTYQSLEDITAHVRVMRDEWD